MVCPRFCPAINRLRKKELIMRLCYASSAMRPPVTAVIAAFGAIVLMTAGAPSAHAQAFAELKTALVDYSKADIQPRKGCEAIGNFKSKDIARIKSAMMPANGAVPAHCRVTGVLSPEIAF